MQVNLTKIILYVMLLAAAIYCGREFVARYSALMGTTVDSDPLFLAETESPALASGSGQEGGTNTVETVPGSNASTNSPTQAPTHGEPDAVEAATNDLETASAPPPAKVQRAPRPEAMSKRDLDGRGASASSDGIALYTFALFGVLITLGVLVAHDVSTFMGQRTHKLLHNEEGEGIHSVAYDQAEDVWANGDYLEAIRLLRDYLNKHPREVHVMARIAEIYEKDLGNHLAAALEYEEFLKQKIPAERWGWAAIHLVNLYYGKLDKPAQGLALLWRIHREYGQTQAAAKARKRLAQIDPDFAVEQARLDREAAEAEAGGEEAEEATEPVPEKARGGRYGKREEAPAESAWQPPAEDPDSHLPKGFRPKKR
jgi:hypothetical protein